MLQQAWILNVEKYLKSTQHQHWSTQLSTHSSIERSDDENDDDRVNANKDSKKKKLSRTFYSKKKRKEKAKFTREWVSLAKRRNEFFNYTKKSN
jgi:hypothetical protein